MYTINTIFIYKFCFVIHLIVLKNDLLCSLSYHFFWNHIICLHHCYFWSDKSIGSKNMLLDLQKKKASRLEDLFLSLAQVKILF